MRLGRLAHDPARIAAAPQHLFGATMPPNSIDRTALRFTPGLWGNDTIPDCTAAALANSARLYSLANGGGDAVIADGTPQRFYAACIGQPDATDAELAVSDGAVMLDVLDRATADGFDAGQQVPLVPGYGAVNIRDRYALAQSIVLGGAYWGVALALADQADVVWDTKNGDQTPGSWGGHALMAVDYTGLRDTDTVRLGTWGALREATWRWVAARLDEAYALSWRQLAAR